MAAMITVSASDLPSAATLHGCCTALHPKSLRYSALEALQGAQLTPVASNAPLSTCTSGVASSWLSGKRRASASCETALHCFAGVSLQSLTLPLEPIHLKLVLAGTGLCPPTRSWPSCGS